LTAIHGLASPPDIELLPSNPRQRYKQIFNNKAFIKKKLKKSKKKSASIIKY